MMIRFSVIVPVYNVNLYIEECIRSIMQQTCPAAEIIIIDDGSTDGSGKVCDRLAKESANIAVVHQQNRGLSAARNTGMNLATGDYLLFVDSDDYLALDALENFSGVLQEKRPDVVIGGAFDVLETGEVTEHTFELRMPEDVKGYEFLNEAIRRRCFQPCAPFYLYKRDFIQKERLSFCEGVLHEDELWSVEVLLAAQTVYQAHFSFYYYRRRAESITHAKNKQKRVESLTWICKKLNEVCSHHKTKEIFWVRDRMAMLYINAIYMGGCEYLKGKRVDKFFPLGCAKTLPHRIKAVLFAVSPYLYIRVMKKLNK